MSFLSREKDVLEFTHFSVDISIVLGLDPCVIKAKREKQTSTSGHPRLLGLSAFICVYLRLRFTDETLTPPMAGQQGHENGYA
jgi:hypothetical protein